MNKRKNRMGSKNGYKYDFARFKEFLLSRNEPRYLRYLNRIGGKKNSAHETTFILNSKGKYKGQALTQALVTGFGVIILILLIVIINSNSVSYKQFVSASQLESTCLMIRAAVEDIQSVSDYRSATQTILGSVALNLPEKIGSSVYRAGFRENNITIETLEEPIMKYSCSSGFNVTMIGASNGGLTEILFVRAETDRMEMRKK